MISMYIFLGLFAISTTFALFLFTRNKKLKDDNKELLSAVKDELVKTTHREGFYDGSYNLSNDNGEKYDYRTYVVELERYKNGYSKLKLIKIDMIHGLHPSYYQQVIDAAIYDFLDIQQTKDITFLEKDEDLMEVRKDKLERILKDKI